MDLLNATRNILNGIMLVCIMTLAFGGRTLDALMVMLIGILCAPLSAIAGQSVPFAYFAGAGLLAYALLNARRLKIPRNNFVLLLSTIIFLLLFLEWLSTVICVFAHAPLSVGWLGLLGRLRGILLYGLSTVFAYNGLRNHVGVGGNTLFSKILSALGIAMMLNLVAVCVQLVHPQYGFRIVSAWYSSESRSTIQAMEKTGMFLRSYGLNYSPVVLGFKSLLSFGGALFHTLMPRNATTDRKAIAVMILSVVNGALSFSKTFILGFVISIMVYWLYGLLPKLRYSSTVSINTKRVLVGCCLLIAFVVVGVSADKLQRATGLPFSYYFSKMIRSPLDAFASRYQYELLPQNAKLMYDVIQAHPVFGVGMTSVVGEFVGDSQYLGVIHNGGIVALFLTLIEIGLVLYVSWARRLHMFFGLFFASAIAGFAVPTLSTDLCLCLLGTFAGYVAYSESTFLNKS